MTPEQLDAIEQRAQAATDGPWHSLGNTIGAEVKTCTCAGHIPGHGHEQFCGLEGPLITGAEPTDAEFIAHARTDVPELVAEVRRLQGQVEAVRELHRDDGRGNCEVCMDFVTQGTYESAYYPCDTIRIVGENDE